MRPANMLWIVGLLIVGTQAVSTAQENAKPADRQALVSEFKAISQQMRAIQQDLIKNNAEVKALVEKIVKLHKELNQKMLAASPELVALQKRQMEIYTKLSGGRPPARP